MFRDIYLFVALHRQKRGALWPSVRREIVIASNLLFLSGADLARKYEPEVFLGDSSSTGYALPSGNFSRTEIKNSIKEISFNLETDLTSIKKSLLLITFIPGIKVRGLKDSIFN